MSSRSACPAVTRCSMGWPSSARHRRRSAAWARGLSPRTSSRSTWRAPSAFMVPRIHAAAALYQWARHRRPATPLALMALGRASDLDQPWPSWPTDHRFRRRRAGLFIPASGAGRMPRRAGGCAAPPCSAAFQVLQAWRAGPCSCHSALRGCGDQTRRPLYFQRPQALARPSLPVGLRAGLLLARLGRAGAQWIPASWRASSSSRRAVMVGLGPFDFQSSSHAEQLPCGCRLPWRLTFVLALPAARRAPWLSRDALFIKARDSSGPLSRARLPVHQLLSSQAAPRTAAFSSFFLSVPLLGDPRPPGTCGSRARTGRLR